MVHAFGVLLLTAMLGSAQSPAVVARDNRLVPTRYDLRFDLAPEARRLTARAELTFRNDGTAPATHATFLLYRLLKVDRVETADGREVPFGQQVVAMSDEDLWQVNRVEATLAAPLAPGASTTLRIDYRGAIRGYTEVMGYVQETNGPDYMLLRAETLPYPILGEARSSAFLGLADATFDYHATFTAPEGYLATCAGDPVTLRPSGATVTSSCADSRPVHTLSFALAKFKVFEDPQAKLRVYALPEDAAAGERILRDMKSAYAFNSDYFGPLENTPGTELIELPDGWGSYTGPGYIFQTAAAFRDPGATRELYHEVSHAWNALAAPELQRTRWFDEAFAMYAQALALRHFQGEEAYRKELNRLRTAYVNDCARDPQGTTVAIADYGKHEIGGFSYTKGAWSLYVLHELLGETAFQRTSTRFQREYRKRPAHFEDFRRIAEAESGCDLNRYFAEWITGTESSELLKGNLTVQALAARYGSHEGPLAH